MKAMNTRMAQASGTSASAKLAIAVNTSVFGADPCPGAVKALAIRATCVGGVTREKCSAFQVREGGRVIWDGSEVVANITGITAVRPASGFVEFEVASGDYTFEATPTPAAACMSINARR